MDSGAKASDVHDPRPHGGKVGQERAAKAADVQDSRTSPAGTATTGLLPVPQLVEPSAPTSPVVELDNKHSPRVALGFTTGQQTQIPWYKNTKTHSFSQLGKEMLPKFSQRMVRGGNRSQILDQLLGTLRTTMIHKILLNLAMVFPNLKEVLTILLLPGRHLSQLTLQKLLFSRKDMCTALNSK